MKKFKFNININNFNINKRVIILTLASIFFLYILYLSIPGLYNFGRVQKVLSDEIINKFNLNISLSSQIEYRIFPQPYFLVKDAKIFHNKSKINSEIAEIKDLKIYISHNNFFDKESLKIKKIKISKANFFFNRENFEFLELIFEKNFPQKNISIEKSKLFFNDKNNQTIFIYSILNSNFRKNEKDKLNIFSTAGEIFNIPIKFEWEENIINNKIISKIDLSKVSINFLNKKIFESDGIHYENFLSILNNDFKTKYLISKNLVTFESQKSYIKNIPIDYKGYINLKPFSFNLDILAKKFNIFYFLNNTTILNEILYNKILIHKNLNGSIRIRSENLIKSKIFNNIDLKINFFDGGININDTVLINNKLGNIYIENSNFIDDSNNILLVGKINFEINNLKEFNKVFLVPKKNREEFGKILIDFSFNISNDEFKIYKIEFYDKNRSKINPKNSEDLMVNNLFNKSDISNPIIFRKNLLQVLSNYFEG